MEYMQYVFANADRWEVIMISEARRVLMLGSRGADVLMLQRILRSIGYKPGPLDGVFGPLTRQAVMFFQADNNLIPDGIVGPLTWAAIDEVYP